MSHSGLKMGEKCNNKKVKFSLEFWPTVSTICKKTHPKAVNGTSII